jgi:membrane-associated phospholipid phosphatase
MVRFYLLLIGFSVCFSGTNAQFRADTLKSRGEVVKPLVAITGAIALGFLVDEAVAGSMERRNALDDIANITDYAGEKTIVVPSLLLTYGLGRFVLEDPRLEETALASVKSVVVTAVFTESVKHLAGRARPFVNEGAWSFHPFPGHADQYKSLPSGHASLAFAVFTPFAEAYSRWIYAIPVSVAAGRIFQNKHWTSDVITGSAVGFLSGYLFYRHRKRVEPIPNGLVIYF